MKKRFQFFCILLIALVLFSPAAVQGENPRKLTLMVYMCGSNLETIGGSASADIREMIEAVPAGRSVTILVMTGGSRMPEGPGYFQQGSTGIYEIGAGGRVRRVLQSEENTNMGDQETLVSLLRYGQENRPAQSYALILWDHGGGPLEGVCWDETSDMDHLTLQEVTGALDEALTQKLDWIGFDACLMGSLEVASAVAPYADYMIASQETEPSFGWNYAFLKEIDKDETGADTGRRIVETYFDGQETSRDTMTLACLDLSKTAPIETAMDAFFSAEMNTLTPDAFTLLSGVRGSVTGFGKAIRAVGEDGYDLVDARGLISALDAEHAAGAELTGLLDDMVISTRSNEEGPGGVSLYYPYMNKKKYQEKWRETYEQLHFSTGYTNHINAFGDLLTGREMTDWSGLTAEEAGFGAEMEPLFSLQLTRDQQANYASAQLLVIRDLITHNALESYCAPVFTGEAQMDGDGLLTAAYTGRSLYLEKENGELYGPVAFGLTEEGKFAYIRMIYLPEDTSDSDRFTHVLYYLETASDTEYPEIMRTRVWDPATRSYSSRILFDESQYGFLEIVEQGRILPEPDDRGLLPMFDEWPANETALIGAFGSLELRLPNRWRFRWIDGQITGEQLYAIFQVTDLQQNVFCCQPIPILNQYRNDSAGIPDETKGESPVTGMTVSVIDSPQEKAVHLTVDVENPSGMNAEYTFSKLIINGERISGSQPAQHSKENSPVLTAEYTILPTELFGLERIDTVEMTVTVWQNGGKREFPAAFRFENCDLPALCRDLKPLAETEQDGVTLQLLSMDPYLDSGIEAAVLFRNEREEDLKPEETAVISGIALHGNPQEPVPAGMTSVLRIQLRNSLYVSGMELETMDENPAFYGTFISDHLLQHRGVTAVADLTLYAHTPGKPEYQEAFSLHLAEPRELKDADVSTYLNTSMTVKDPEENPAAPTELLMLAEGNQYTVGCEKILLGKNGAALGLEITNRTSLPVKVFAKDPYLDRENAAIDQADESGAWMIPPQSVRICALVIRDRETTLFRPAPETIGIGFASKEQKDQGQEGAACVIRLPGTAETGKAPAVWLRPEQLQAEKVLMPETVLPSQQLQTENSGALKMLEEEVALAENARRYTQWIPANLTEAQAERIESGMMFLIRKNSQDQILVLSLHGLGRNENGIPGTRCSGLELCPADDPDNLLFTFHGWKDQDHMDVHLMTALSGYNKDMEIVQTADRLVMETNFSENSARITGAEWDGEGGGITKVLTIPSVRKIPEDMGEPLPPVLSWESKMETRILELNGEPLRLMLRPVTAADEVYVIFCVKEKDGTEYSLPMFPYPAEK